MPGPPEPHPSATARQSPRWAVAAVAAALALLASACGLSAGDGPSALPGTDGTEPASGEALPLGELEITGPGDTCLPGAGDCREFRVSCPGLEDAATGEVDVREATGPARGTVALFTSSGGGSWWLEDSPGSEGLIEDFRSAGLTVVQVRWKRGSWLYAAPGEDAGTSHVACRPATVVRWVHDEVYEPLGVDGDVEPLQCGFCIAGVSAGASQISYALAFYGLDEIVDVAVPISGPPHADEARGCLRAAGDEEFWLEDRESVNLHVDGSYGYVDGRSGPCAERDESMVDRWQEESVATGGNDYDYPDTRIQFIFGEEDDTGAADLGQEYAKRLVDEGSPHVSVEIVPGMGHGLAGDGLAALRTAVLG
jgi:hypothetical protein